MAVWPRMCSDDSTAGLPRKTSMAVTAHVRCCAAAICHLKKIRLLLSGRAPDLRRSAGVQAGGLPGDGAQGAAEGVASERQADGNAAVATAARRLIAEYAWTWLAGGHLLRLADLQRALALVPCSLAALMQTFPAGEPAGFSAEDVIAAVKAISVEVPVDEQPALLSTAHDLLLLFHYIYAPPWRLAMAVCLGQQTHLQQMRQRAPKVWSEVRACIMADDSLRDLAAVMQN